MNLVILLLHIIFITSIPGVLGRKTSRIFSVKERERVDVRVGARLAEAGAGAEAEAGAGAGAGAGGQPAEEVPRPVAPRAALPASRLLRRRLRSLSAVSGVCWSSVSIWSYKWC